METSRVSTGQGNLTVEASATLTVQSGREFAGVSALGQRIRRVDFKLIVANACQEGMPFRVCEA